MNRKTLITALASATLGGLGVGYITLGPSASADRAAIVDDSTETVVDDSTGTGTDSTGTDTDTPAEPGERFKEHVQDALAPLITDGTLTQAEVDKIITALDAARPEPGERGGPGGGRGGRHGRPMGQDRGEILTLVAETIGIEVDALRTELRAGSTIAAVATANSVDPQKVIDVLVLQATAKIDEKVAAGDITAERAADIKANLLERTTKFVNETGPRGRGHGRGEAPADDAGTDSGS